MVQNLCKPAQHVRKQRRLLRSMDGFLKYGWLPEKEAETLPCQKLFMDLIGPYKIKNKSNNQELTLSCLTMIDPSTEWMEIKEIKNKEAF